MIRLLLGYGVLGLVLWTINTYTTNAQYMQYVTQHVITQERPYGSYNPIAPIELKDYEPLIGSSQCLSMRRKPDGAWQDTIEMVWEFRYVFDGTAIQDITWKEDGGHSSSIRQYDPENSEWVVTYFSSQSANHNPPTWTGNRKGDRIILTMPQKSPNGQPGTSRLTFYDIRRNSFNWIGEWVSKDGSVVYPFWKISCRKKNEGMIE